MSVRVSLAGQGSVRARIDGVGEQLYPMAADGSGGYRVTVSWSDPNIVWYSFIVRTTDGFESRVGAPEGHVGGEGVTYYDRADVPSLRISVARSSGAELEKALESLGVLARAAVRRAHRRAPRAEERREEALIQI